MIKKISIYNWIFLALMALFLVWGLSAFKDYGISWDEEIQRGRGLAGLRTYIILTRGEEALPERLKEKDVTARGYGVMGMKLPVVLAEYATGFRMSNDKVFKLYHLYNFLVFYISVFFLYLMLLFLGFGEGYALLGAMLYILCPRILADSFYNNKDLLFLAMFTICLSLSVMLVSRFTFPRAVLLAAASAFMMTVRTVGAFGVVVFALYFLARALLSRDLKVIKRDVLRLAFTVAVCVAVQIAITPKMWVNFSKAVISKVTMPFTFVHGGFELILGQVMNRLELPWYYLPLTIVMTVPCIYIIFTVYGLTRAAVSALASWDGVGPVLALIRSCIKAEAEASGKTESGQAGAGAAEKAGGKKARGRKKAGTGQDAADRIAGGQAEAKAAEAGRDERGLYIAILWLQFVFILAYTIVLKPMQYNLWRHFYFIFVYMVVFSVYGIRMAVETSNKGVALAVRGFTLVSLLLSVIWIAMNHPYEYLYFNPLFSGRAATETVQDYWAVSYKGLLSQIIDGSTTDVWIRPNLTGNQLFGQAGWENYHLETLKNSAKYRIEEGNPGDNAFYKILKTVEQDGRICESLIRREAYGNVIRKYYYEDGDFGGVNYGPEVEFTAYTQDTDSCILMRLPSGLSVEELDVLYGGMYRQAVSDDDGEEVEKSTDGKEDILVAERAYVSDDGETFRALSESELLREDDLLGIRVREGTLPEYILLKYENCLSHGTPDLAFRFFGDENEAPGKIAGQGDSADGSSGKRDRSDIYYNRYEASEMIKALAARDSEGNSLDTQALVDGSEYTALIFGSGMSGGETIEFELGEEPGLLRGLHIDCGSFPMGSGRDIVIEGSEDGSDYTELSWYYGTADDYLFENESSCRYYRISQMGRSRSPWHVSEIGLIHR